MHKCQSCDQTRATVSLKADLQLVLLDFFFYRIKNMGRGSNPLSFFLLHNLQFKIILDGVGQHNLQEPVPSCFFILSTWSGKDTRAIYGPPHRTAPKLAIVNSPHLPFTPFSSYCATILHSNSM